MDSVHQGYDPGGHGYQDRHGDQRQYQAEEYPPEGDNTDREEDEDYSDRIRGLERSLSDYVHLLLRDGWTCPGGQERTSTSGNGRLHSVTMSVA
jgi:hypothetical protein